ncbi:structural maintenance of chromosomes protein 1a [Plakobranchus ocellatus]|uniref:Structural maintenance of chromosomes protein 1a n=1 Tax=Plakobranchus ocellatus TaxID=259542 RepID=A0AAV4A307_9GAST|nr:structural maintenance of chromosomes protein 1a [Plakobranchus ocellatus]
MCDTGLYASLLLFFTQFLLAKAVSGEGVQYDFFINKFESRRSNLSCFQCYNGDNTDCMGMSNINKIPTRNCFINEPFCKVRRFSIEGRLTTFDRYCAEACTPGCQEGGLYSECVSCCNHRSFCNVGNSAQALIHTMLFPVHAQCLLVLSVAGLILQKKIN